MKNRLILASRSPRRSEMLHNLGLEFDAIPSEVKEDILREESPEQHVVRLAKAKAMDVGRRYPDRWVIAADTIVLLEGAILGKPKSKEEAVQMLGRLSGQEHHVLTGFSVRHFEKGKEGCQTVETVVRVKDLLPEEIRWYVHTGEPMDKAGAYGVQAIGAFMIESIHGSYTNVVGLPLCELIRMLNRLGAITLSNQGFQIKD